MARLQLALVAVAGVVAACASPTSPSPTAGVAVSSAPTAGASQGPSGSPVAVEGGCGATQVLAGPGPDARLGLADNPWAWATPADSGIVAYFWYPPPGVLSALRDPNDPNTGNTKILWITHGAGTGQLTVAARPSDASSPVVRFTFPPAASPADNYPSSIGLPSPGCWHLDLTLGTVRAAMDLTVATAPPK